MHEPLSYLDQVQRGVDYIEAHLEEDFPLHEVSRAAGISHWHFQRIFKSLTGETLMTYVRSRRMAHAMDKLLKTKKRILDIALDAGFETQESFTRAFKAAFKMTPGAFRRLGDGTLFLQKARFDAAYLEHINQRVSAEPVIEERGAMRLVGLRTIYYGRDSHKNNLSDKLPGLWAAFVARAHEIPIEQQIEPSLYYGVIRQTAAESDQLEYHAAVEVSEACEPPEGMVETRIEAARYALFEHRGFPEQLDHTVNYVYSTWLMQSSLRHTYAPDLELYDKRYYRPGVEDSVVHYAIPVG